LSLRLDRVARAIERLGLAVTVDSLTQIALLRPIAIGQLQTYVSSGEFASWERPVYSGIFLSSAAVTEEDDFVGPDFEGKIRRVVPIRVMGELIAKQAIIQVVTPPEGP
jgi:hypothetical protein